MKRTKGKRGEGRMLMHVTIVFFRHMNIAKGGVDMLVFVRAGLAVSICTTANSLLALKFQT